MDTRSQRGMVTAEFTVGTLGTVLIAAVLYKLGVSNDHNPWFESFKEIVQRALMWRDMSHFIPGLGIFR